MSIGIDIGIDIGINDINDYFNNIVYTNEENKIEMKELNNNIIKYLYKLVTIINDTEFIKLVNKGLAQKSVKLLTMSIGKLQDSIYDIHQNDDKIILKLLEIPNFNEKDMLSVETIYNNLVPYFNNINIPEYNEIICSKAQDDGSFYDDFYELLLLGKNNVLPLQNNIDNLSSGCMTYSSLIHDAWALKTFFKYNNITHKFDFNINGFKKNGNFNFSRLELCVNFIHLSSKEQVKDILSYVSICYINKFYRINYINAIKDLEFRLKIQEPNIVDTSCTSCFFRTF